jgi:hypothetical protein
MRITFEIEEGGQVRQVKKRKKASPLRKHFKALGDLLFEEGEPSKQEIVDVVLPLVEILDESEELDDGLLDMLPPKARRSVLMLFLMQMMQEQPKKEGYPDKIPLDISEGDDISEDVTKAHVPYNQAQKNLPDFVKDDKI